MKTFRIEIANLPHWRDARGEGICKQIAGFLKIAVDDVRTRDVYTIYGNFEEADAEKIADGLFNPVLQSWRTEGGKSSNYEALPEADAVIVVGFRPGVTDNVGRTAKGASGDILGRKLAPEEQIFSSVEYLVYGKLELSQLEFIATKLLANELIQTICIVPRGQAIPQNLPLVQSTEQVQVKRWNLDVSDEELLQISRKGTLALTLEEMKIIRKYFLEEAKGRDAYGLNTEPTDVELEVLAQTWSEHCKHKIFDADIDYDNTEDKIHREISSCYKTFIKRSTNTIAKTAPWLLSVFHDNAGVIAFNDKVDVCYKVETHNSPSALDPYGGAMTGIVGVNRDPMGTGQGAQLLVNVWGYCLGSPFTERSEVPAGLLHPRRLRDGVHKGVIDGGNQSGIPYGSGWEYFDQRYLGKPLVYCGTVGVLPKRINGRKGYEKAIEPGDLIVMAGGRIGKDGIHGATFSSEELNKNSPVQAVQIGDPITQKKLGDFQFEARDRGLYRFVTDNGAGGLSSSIGEMAELANGCRMDLGKAPLKYAGLQPWEILVSEAQERMSYAVPKDKIEEFQKLAADRDVEVTVLGEFTNDGKFHVLYNGETVCLLDISFMHGGLPKLHLKAKWVRPVFPEVDYRGRELAKDFLDMMARLNICSDEFKARQYDHEVKGLSVVKPFVGRNRDVQSDATVTMIEPLSKEGIILSSAILPRYSDVDTYHMTASVIDLAIRRIIAVGGQMKMIAGLDNFCWPDPVQSEKTPDGEYKLAQLVRANRALYEYTIAFGVPCISGKDSMKNDSTIGGKKISIPPSLLFSAISKMDDITKAVTLDAKHAGDLVYVIGVTKDELGGSEYFAMLGGTGNKVPTVDAQNAKTLYGKVGMCTQSGILASLTTPALGGLAVALAKTAIGGDLGLSVDLGKLPVDGDLDDFTRLFSESNSRFVATVSADKAIFVERLLAGSTYACVGEVTAERTLAIKGRDGVVTRLALDDLAKNYKSTLAGI
ncbi:MAG: AIR synthase-related protein [Victivallaceae bacterium]|nr:AIR synthase-related protein [Victivallaceae bacterium]